MSARDDGGPAFPAEVFTGNVLFDYASQTNTMETRPVPGMTLRDYFAARAMHALILAAEDQPTRKMLRERGVDVITVTAEGAYRFADEMLKARSA